MIGDDGYLTIVGRSKDLIITGGYNVYPKEIELAIDGLTGILESAVVGIPHPDAAMTASEVDAWFGREVLPLEAALMQFLQHNWRNKADIADLRPRSAP